MKPAAIWARVSTKGQKEISPDTQINACKQLLESKDYVATKIFNVDYCSLLLFDCPEFQELRSLIRNKQISALCVYDRDRLEANPIQRLTFIDELNKAKIEVLVCYGPPIIDSDTGMLIEHVLVMGKKAAVLRARNGSRDGLRDRVMIKRRPVSWKSYYGYQWDRDNVKLVPNADYPNVKRIFDMLLSGASFYEVIDTLEKHGITTPSGLSKWNIGSLSRIVHSPIYAGRYIALKTSNVRDDDTSPSKLKNLPENEWKYIPEIKIENPPITWQQRTMIQEQINRHVNLSSRHARRQYLLRGMIECDEHVGIRGNHRKYHGKLSHDTFGYICPVNQHHFVTGPILEKAVKNTIINLFKWQQSDFWQKFNDLEKINKPQLESELKKQQAKLSKALQNEAKLEERHINGEIDNQVYELLHVKFHTQRKALENGTIEIQRQLEATNDIDSKVAALKDIRKHFLNDVEKFTDKQWRILLEKLDCQIRIISSEIKDSNDLTLRIVKIQNELSQQGKFYTGETYPKLKAILSLKSPFYLHTEAIKDIDLSIPWNTQSNNRLSLRIDLSELLKNYSTNLVSSGAHR